MRGRKKIKLTKLQREILGFPGEDGLASLPGMIMHLAQKRSIERKQEFLTEMEIALIKLRRLGDLYIDRLIDGRRHSLLVDEWKEFYLEKLLIWSDEEGNYKVNPNEPNTSDVLIQLSQGGVKDLELYYRQNPEDLE